MTTARKLKKALGVKKNVTVLESPMQTIDARIANARPAAWKSRLLPSVVPGKEHKNQQVPLALDDQIVADVADGRLAAEIQRAYGLRDGYVRTVLLRRFGSIEGMKKALQAQCLENAIALNDYAISRIGDIPPDRALVGAKIMIDGALALEKSRVDRPTTVDFASLAVLGGTLERLEKIVTGSDRTVTTS